MTYMLDTNICIFILKNRPPKLRKKFKAIKNLCLSSVTYGELCFGIENGSPHLQPERWQQLADFTQSLNIEPWGEAAAQYYGRVRANLKKEGRIIGNNDLLIAAHALSVDAILVSNNTREFSRVANLKLEDWLGHL